MHETLSITAALLIGLVGSPHCIGMCGGIVSLFTMAGAQNRASIGSLSYNMVFQFGRVSCYALLGTLAGLAGSLALDSHAGFINKLHWASLILLIGIALSIIGWWNPYSIIEKAGGKLWKKIQPLGKHILPINSKAKAYALGLVWGFLPCGLIYSTLAWSATAGNPGTSALLMVFFGLGTMPALLGIGSFAGELKTQMQRTAPKYMLALLLIVIGLLPFYAHTQHTGANQIHTDHTDVQHNGHAMDAHE